MNLHNISPSAYASFDTKDKWICNIRFVTSAVCSLINKMTLNGHGKKVIYVLDSDDPPLLSLLSVAMVILLSALPQFNQEVHNNNKSVLLVIPIGRCWGPADFFHFLIVDSGRLKSKPRSHIYELGDLGSPPLTTQLSFCYSVRDED